MKLSIGNYEDKALSNIVPMKACYILLGRPWQFDKKIIHNGLTNEIAIHHKDTKCVLHSLEPSKVLQDQIQMRKMRDEERKVKRKHKDPREQAPNSCIQYQKREGESNTPSKVTHKDKNCLRKLSRKISFVSNLRTFSFEKEHLHTRLPI